MNWKIETDETKYLWIALLIPLLTIADIGLTAINVRNYQEAYPELEYGDIEANQLVIGAWNKFGFYPGTIIFGSIVLAIMVIFSIQIYKRRLPLVFGGLVFGAYLMVLYNHILLLGVWAP